MNFLKKGPEIKLSELKVPDFVYDLYHDLKERHLLPLVAILLVAMVAVPIYLESSKHSSDSEPDATLPKTATASTAGGEEALVVSRTEPGLRELRRRFKRYRALDPFAEKGAEAAPEEASEVSGASAESSAEEPPVEATVIGGESSEAPPVEYSPPVETPSAPVEVPTVPTAPESRGSDGGPTKTRYASNSIDVRIVTVPRSSQASAKTRAKQMPKAEVRRNLPELTMLPARATPAVAFMGTSRDGKKALFLVSSDVVSLFGEGSCVIGSESCQLLALEPNLPETFVYGPREHTYRIELLKISRTLSAKPRRAALGSTNHAKAGGAKGAEKSGEADEAAPTKPSGRGEAAG